MPYAYSDTPPNMKMVLESGDPKYCCRAPRSGGASRVRTRLQTYFPSPSARVVLERFNPTFDREETFYCVEFPRKVNAAVLPACDPRIVWGFNGASQQQCALPFVDGCDFEAVETCIVRVDQKRGCLPRSTAVHPECWASIVDPASLREIPENAVLNLCRLCDAAREAEIEQLRGGALVCCYFL